jgi:hypothetical protein
MRHGRRRRCYEESSSSSSDSSDSSDGSSEEEEEEEEEEEGEVRAPQTRGYARGLAAEAAGGIYALEHPRTGQVYVGKTTHMDRRMQEHAEEHPGLSLKRLPLLTQGVMVDLESWERNEVLTRMYRDGTDAVRGWKYTRKGALTRKEELAARDDIMEKFDLCRRCGRTSHFKAACFARTGAPWCARLSGRLPPRE